MDKDIYVTRSSMPEYEEYIEAIKPLWNTHLLTNMGRYHKELEKQLKDYLEIDNLSLFCNGHMSLEMVIQAMGLTGEVITTPFTFISTTHSIVRNGLEPVFCDIDSVSMTMDASKIEDLITEKTSAIIPVHVYGNICNVEEIDRIAKKYNLKVIYDAAHAFGVKKDGVAVGNFGDASVYSFHATKVFNTIEGGAVTFREGSLEEKLYNLKNFGIRSEEVISQIGANAKMNEFESIMGLCNLRHIQEELEKRKKVVERYRENLSNIKGLRITEKIPGVQENYSYFPVVCEEKYLGITRDELYDELAKNNIYARKYFYPLTADQACFKNKYKNCDIPVARYISNRILTLPLYADLSIEDVDRICSIILKLQKAKCV
ncbi:MAG: DegT/DnrJ/EryC1/StrS family aminotransferase [Clostridium sp.]|nr:DegT/DnrJ/EryC1/StrS family aminotransferase [Clostridium sp.]